MKLLTAGAAIIDITPQKALFLHGYPHVERISEGVHDPLYASALILDNGEVQVGFCAVEVLYISAEIADRVREKVSKATGIKKDHLMISASHTHSGPVTVSDVFYDPVVPPADPQYIDYLVEKLVMVYIAAFQDKRECKIAVTTANASGVGGNRRSKTDAVDAEVPIIVLKDKLSNEIYALSTVYCMHPTVLHEDSKLYSADFPGYTREYIKENLGNDVILLYHTGPAGNQSPRHFITSNSFEEARRLGFMLGEKIYSSVSQLNENDFKDRVRLSVKQSRVMLPEKAFMNIDEAEKKVVYVKSKLERMRREKAPSSEIRTVECDWFGAEENKQLARMAAEGKLKDIYARVLPAEISVVAIDDTRFVFMPGELFVEYSLKIKEKFPNTFTAALSNGVLVGYIVTEEAEKEGGYEASNSIFPAKAGEILLKETFALLETLKKR